MTAYDLPIGTEIVIGKRRWMLVHRMKQNPDLMRWREITGHEPDPLPSRTMYPSEVQAMLDAGFECRTPTKGAPRE